jgi:membrane-associated phospholipid phosphatase
MRNMILILLFIGHFETVWTQNKTTNVDRVYQFNRKLESSISLGLFTVSSIGLFVLNNKTSLDYSQIVSLNKKDIWTIDRKAVEQTYSSTTYDKSTKASDWGLNLSVFLPGLLILDKKIKNDMSNILLLYLETQAINISFYTYGGVMFTNRIRPIAYYPEATQDGKFSNHGIKDSFFSGHVSTVATASFFMAKVYSDYHPEIKRMKWLLYASALVPPAYVGYHRYKALKHFPTDIFTGIALGVATGILVPELHKIQFGKKQNLSILPFTGKMTGLSIQFKF